MFTRKTIIGYGLVVVVWLLTVSPSIFLAHWFYLDVPTIVYYGKTLFHNLWLVSPLSSSGRFVPFYWLYQWITYHLVNVSLWGDYIVQSLVILASVFVMYAVIRRLTGSVISGLISVIVFLTSSPIAENVYTLGKPEHLITLGFLSTVLLLLNLLDPSKSRIRHIAYISLVSLLSVWSKETSVVFIVLGLSGMVISRIGLNGAERYRAMQAFLLYSLGTGAGVLFARLPPLLYNHSSGTYTSYSLTLNIVKTNIVFYLTQQPDVLAIGLLSTFLGITNLIIKRNNYEIKSVIGVSLTIVGWAYIGGLLVWRWPYGYYLYVPSGIFALSLSLMIDKIIHEIKTRPISLVVIGIVLMVSRVYAIAYSWYISTVQVSASSLYNSMLTTYDTDASNGQKLVSDQWTFFDEQISQSNLLLHRIWRDSGKTMIGVQDGLDPTMLSKSTLSLYGVTKIPSVADRLPRQGDYVVVFNGSTPSSWILRGVEYSGPFIEGSGIHYAGLRQVEVRNITLPILYFSHGVIPKTGSAKLGYSLFEVGKNTSYGFWSGRYPDDWIGKDAAYYFYGDSSEPNAIQVKVPSILGLTRVQVYLGNDLIKSVSIGGGRTGVIDLPRVQVQPTPQLLRFVVDKTFVPKAAGINDDTRTLSVQVSVVPRGSLSWIGRYSDRWMGPSAQLVTLSPSEQLQFDVPAPSCPENIVLSIDGVITRTLEFTHAGRYTVTLYNRGTGPHTVQISAATTFVPKSLGINDDSRSLSVQITAKAP